MFLSARLLSCATATGSLNLGGGGGALTWKELSAGAVNWGEVTGYVWEKPMEEKGYFGGMIWAHHLSIDPPISE